MGCLSICCAWQDGDKVQAKVLIGADGYFSGVRAQMLDDGPPEFTGNVMWRARFPLRSGFTTDRTRYLLTTMYRLFSDHMNCMLVIVKHCLLFPLAYMGVHTYLSPARMYHQTICHCLTGH